MSVINYTETALERGYKIVSWSSIFSGDTTQPLDLTGYEILSAHAYRPSAGSIVADIYQSNEVGAPTKGYQQTAFASFTNDAQIIAGTGLFKSRWIYFLPSGTQHINIDLLLKAV